jgi:DNA ligase (NAD+)
MNKSQVEIKIKKLSDEIEIHNHNYYVNDAPTISDFEFDKLLEINFAILYK